MRLANTLLLFGSVLSIGAFLEIIKVGTASGSTNCFMVSGCTPYTCLEGTGDCVQDGQVQAYNSKKVGAHPYGTCQQQGCNSNLYISCITVFDKSPPGSPCNPFTSVCHPGLDYRLGCAGDQTLP